MAFRRGRRSSSTDPAPAGDASAPEAASAPEPPPRSAAGRRPDDEAVRLDDDEHAWWAKREALDLGAPKGRRRGGDDRPVIDLDDPWAIDKLFDFVPDYDLNVDDVELPPDQTFDPSVPFDYPDEVTRGRPPVSPASDGLFRADDPYAVIGVPSTATWEEITEAHRRLARLHHPDRLVDASDEARAKSEQRMREVNIAYSELRRRRAR